MKNITTEEQEKVLKDLLKNPMSRPVLLMERCLCLWFLINFVPDLIIFVLLFATIYFFFFLKPKLASTGLSGFDGFVLFISDGFMFLSSLHKTSLLWRQTALLYLIDWLRDLEVMAFGSDEDFDHKPRSRRTLRPPQPTEPREIKEDWCLVNNMQCAELGGVSDDFVEEGDVIKEVEKTRRLLKELKEDGKKMDMEMEFMEHTMHSYLEKDSKNLSAKILELREELRDDGKKMRTYKELMKNFGNSVHGLGLNVDEDSEASREEVKSVAEQVQEAYLLIQETTKAAKTTADRVNLTCLAAQSISTQIKSEALEGFPELREEVRRISLDFAARRKEAKAAADKAAKELSRATVELVEAVGIRQSDEYKTD